MDISKYSIFVKTIELGSLTKAGYELGYTQSAASHMLSSLEKELGFPLLLRSRSGIRLTSAGEAILPLAREIVRCHTQLIQLADSVNGLETGIVEVATFTSVAIQWLPSIISEFKELYPGIAIRILDGDYEQVESWISSGRADCGFIVKKPELEFSTTPLKEDRLLVILPRGHRLCSYKKIPLRELRKEAFIIPAEGIKYNIGTILKKASLKPERSFNMASDYSSIAMVRGGHGITILPELVLKGITHSGIEVRELEECGVRTICLASLAPEKLSPAVKRFMRFVKSWVAAH
jgi:DNA-binding transcriptional LysR family regulator